MKHIIGTTINGVDYNTMIFENDTFYPAGYDGEVKLYGTLGMIGLDQNKVALIIFNDNLDVVYDELISEYKTEQSDCPENDELVRSHIRSFIQNKRL